MKIKQCALVILRKELEEDANGNKTMDSKKKLRNYTKIYMQNILLCKTQTSSIFHC